MVDGQADDFGPGRHRRSAWQLCENGHVADDFHRSERSHDVSHAAARALVLVLRGLELQAARRLLRELARVVRDDCLLDLQRVLLQ